MAVKGLAVVGIGADGWAGLVGPGRDALVGADVIFGSARQLRLLPDTVGAERVEWPMPLLPTLVATLAAHPGGRRVVLASGDPTFHGIAPTLARLLPEVQLDVVPHPSSVSLACARLGWAQQDIALVSAVGRSLGALHVHVHPGRRVLVLAGSPSIPAEACHLLRERGFGPSVVTALSELGGPGEQRVSAIADSWPDRGWPPGAVPSALTVFAVECVPGPAAVRLPLTPGLPDDAYEHDGQLTKRHVRALTLAALAPSPGELLWDVGGGAGSVGIEWMRSHPSCRAVAVEQDEVRAKRIVRNAVTLGVPGIEVVLGSAPSVLAGLASPDAVFIGGGMTAPGLVEACWTALRHGGRIVANVTTLESERVVLGVREQFGGTLTRVELAHEAPVGRFTGWRPAMPVTQWVAVR